MDRWSACNPPHAGAILACLDQAVLAPDQVIGIEPVQRNRLRPRRPRSTRSSRAASR